MTVQQFQELVVDLSIAERLQIARWLIGTALPDDEPTLSTSTSGVPEDQERQVLENEIDAFRAIHPQLFARIPEQYAAIHQGELIDHDVDQFELYMRVQEQYKNVPVLIRQVLSTPDRDIVIRSPRFEHA